MELGDLKAELEDERIVVTMPGTLFKSTYLMSPDEPKLIQAPAVAVDKAAEISSKEFEVLAWEIANAKAKELGWIVNSS